MGAAVLLAIVALAGCGGAPAEKETAPTLTMTGAAPHGALPPPAAPAPTVTATPAPVPAPERQYPEPTTLNGLDAAAVANLLGTPRFKRRDDPAEIWQYRNESCALDVFLYRAGRDGAYTVRHFETRGRDKKTVEAKDCFVSLLKAHEKGRAG